ncbi:MAG: hypothetical protein OHK0044_14690 [Burkholderiaceae bacterium]
MDYRAAFARGTAPITLATGATSASAATTPADEWAQLRVVASNVYGSVTSHPATLTGQ